MKIAILGTRGIPNNYGGFEQFAEFVSIAWVQRGHDVTVYNPHFHNYQKEKFNGIEIIYKYCPENIFGSAAHFFYDYICLKDALNREFDIILELGYQSVAISYNLLPINRSIIVTNMDGLEWKRAKWSSIVKKLTKWFEKIGVEKSHYLVSDNKGIYDYIFNTYHKTSTMIPYGAKIFENADDKVLENYAIKKYTYYVLIARIEPENNIETILDGYINSTSKNTFIVVGNNKTKYGFYLKKKYQKNKNIKFIGGVYDINILNNIRYFANIYFHGHSVGGTNPSLLEAMASKSFIVAHKNIFNESVLEDAAYYFENSDAVTRLINNFSNINKNRNDFIQKNLTKVKNKYSWNIIAEQYLELFKKAIYENSNNNTK